MLLAPAVRVVVGCGVAGAPSLGWARTGACNEPAGGTAPAPGSSGATSNEPRRQAGKEATAPRPAGRPSSAAESLGRVPGRVRCLDASLADDLGRRQVRKGVQKRPFRKRLRVSLSVLGGGVAGDLSDTSWQVGGRLGFWFSESFGLAAGYRLAPVTLRIERSATAFTGQDRYPDGQAANLSHTAMGYLLWAPFHTKLRSPRYRVVHGDFVLLAGAGPTIHDSARGAGLEFGGALFLYPTRWLSIRLDLSDHVLSQEILGSRRISNSLVFSAGLGLWIPFR